MPTDKEVMQMALDALDDSMRIMHTHGVAFGSSTIHARKALEAELAKPEPKPIALGKLVKNGLIQGCECLADAQVAEYTRPGWVPLYRKGDL